MDYNYYVLDVESSRQVPVVFRAATSVDFDKTIFGHWQTNWHSGYLQDQRFDKYAMVVADSGELISLLACQPDKRNRAAKLVYLESHPASNPTLVKGKLKKYHGIGKAFMAFAVDYSLSHGGDGSLYFKAKTTELYWHYIRDFGACPLRHGSFDLFLFASEAKLLQSDYTRKEDVQYGRQEL